MGRPTKLDDLTAKRICDALKAGVSRRAAAAAGNVDYATFKRWMASDDDLNRAFRARVEAAEASPEREAVDCIMNAVREGDWKAADTWLSKRRAIDWASKAAAIHDERVDEEALSEDAMRSVAEAILSRKAG